MNTASLDNRTEKLVRLSKITSSALPSELYDSFIRNQICGKDIHLETVHQKLRDLRDQWQKCYKEAATTYVWHTSGSLGQQVATVLKTVAEGAMPDIPEDRDLLRRTAIVQAEYLLLRINLRDYPHHYEVLFTREHMSRHVDQLQTKDLLNEEDEEFLELYARFERAVGSENSYEPEHRQLWLEELSANMLRLARKFNKPLYWLNYGRSQELIVRIIGRKDHQIDAIGRCLEQLKSAVGVPDAKILQGIFYRLKASLLAHPENQSLFIECFKWAPPSKESVGIWQTSQECVQDIKGDLLNADLHRRLNEYLWSCVAGIDTLEREQIQQATRSIVNKINLHTVSMYAFHDEWWQEIYTHLYNVFGTTATSLKSKEEFYKFLSQYPLRVASRINLFGGQNEVQAKRKLHELPLKENLIETSNKKQKIVGEIVAESNNLGAV